MLGDFGIPEDSIIPALLSSPVVGDSILIVKPWDLRRFLWYCGSLEDCAGFTLYVQGVVGCSRFA
jgi:hypothetical protein